MTNFLVLSIPAVLFLYYIIITYSSPSLTHSTSTPLGMLLVHQGSLLLPRLLPLTLSPWCLPSHPLSSSFQPVTHLVRLSEVCHTCVTITLDLTHCVVHVYLPTFMGPGGGLVLLTRCTVSIEYPLQLTVRCLSFGCWLLSRLQGESLREHDTTDLL